VVIHAPGQLNLGRTNRLANAAQRRVLRAIYPGCAIPGCSTRFDYCKIHHVVWWRHGGPTDLANLLPICVRHHSCVHDRGWTLQLESDRTLIVTRPDGIQMTTGPPSRHAA
jgi:predicted restriction endonuclease